MRTRVKRTTAIVIATLLVVQFLIGPAYIEWQEVAYDQGGLEGLLWFSTYLWLFAIAAGILLLWDLVRNLE